MKLLIEKGAEVNTKDIQGTTPLHLVLRNGSNESAALLIKKRGGQRKGRIWRYSVASASQEGHTDIATLLIEKGVDVNAKDKEGKTPLHWASKLKEAYRHCEIADREGRGC